MRWVDLAGYAASSMVFLTFYMKGMVPLRVVALCSNVAFLVYGGMLHLVPIFMLLPRSSRSMRAGWYAPGAASTSS